MQNEQTETKAIKRLSRDPNKAMQEMMVTIDSLREALLEETAALKDADTKTFLDLQDKKLDIARHYLDGMSQLLNRKEELKQADPVIQDKLEEKRSLFSEAAQDNHAAIKRMQSGMKRLGERIMEKAREAARKEEQLIYGASGQMYSGIRASVGVNESA